VARARELDQFASSHDAQLSFTLRARNAAWSPGYVNQHAARHGLRGRRDSRAAWCCPANTPGTAAGAGACRSTPQAALAEDPSHSAIRELTLSLDVPQVHARRAAVRAHARGRHRAGRSPWTALITDDDGQVIPAGGAGRDRRRPRAACTTPSMSRDLSAGSPQARRLFQLGSVQAG
jgi:hypothetical protein